MRFTQHLTGKFIMIRCDCGAFKNNVGVCPNCGTGSYEISPATKVRRRIEDYLRKAPEQTIMKVAESLNIRID